MLVKTKQFEIRSAQTVNLKNFKTRVRPYFQDETQTKDELKKCQKQLSDYQELLYAQNQWSVLIVLQGMDTSGKDGLIEHVMKSVNPQGCDVTSFKQPTHLERDHDFLWRINANLPQRGKIGVFNRSHYEDIIAPFVHPEYIENSQLPKKVISSKKILQQRCHDIVNFEKYLARQGTVIIKIFLHLSKQEQKNRLLSRLEIPEKNWKFEASDMTERTFWDKYQKAYGFCFENTSHKEAPWHIIPADDKPTARLIASHIIVSKMAELNLCLPTVDATKKKLLTKYRTQLKHQK